MSYRSLLVFDQDSGRIHISQRGGMKDRVIDDYGRDGQHARFVPKLPANPGSYFVERGDVLRRRTPLKAKLDRKTIPAGGEIRIDGVPSGASVFVTDGLIRQEYRSDGSAVHLTLPDPGIYIVSIDAFPHLERQFSITVR